MTPLSGVLLSPIIERWSESGMDVPIIVVSSEHENDPMLRPSDPETSSCPASFVIDDRDTLKASQIRFEWSGNDRLSFRIPPNRPLRLKLSIAATDQRGVPRVLGETCISLERLHRLLPRRPRKQSFIVASSLAAQFGFDCTFERTVAPPSANPRILPLDASVFTTVTSRRVNLIPAPKVPLRAISPIIDAPDIPPHAALSPPPRRAPPRAALDHGSPSARLGPFVTEGLPSLADGPLRLPVVSLRGGRAAGATLSRKERPVGSRVGVGGTYQSI